MEKSKLGDNLKKELIKNSLDLSKDYSEIFIDDLLDDGIIKEIPIVRTLVSSAKMIASIREKYVLKKFLVFLQQFHNGQLDEIKYSEFKQKIDSDSKYRNVTLERIMVIIDRLDEIEKVKIQSNLFVNYVNQKIDWGYFKILSKCLERMNPKCIKLLDYYSKNDWADYENNKKRIDFESQSLLTSAGIAIRHNSSFLINNYGKDLHYFGINKTR